jgi:hypothetical protein
MVKQSDDRTPPNETRRPPTRQPTETRGPAPVRLGDGFKHDGRRTND